MTTTTPTTFQIHGSDCSCGRLCSETCHWRFLGQYRRLSDARQWAARYKRQGVVKRTRIFRSASTLGIKELLHELMECSRL